MGFYAATQMMLLREFAEGEENAKGMLDRLQPFIFFRNSFEIPFEKN